MSYLSNYEQQKYSKNPYGSSSYNSNSNMVTPITPNQTAMQVPFSPSLNYSQSFQSQYYNDNVRNDDYSRNDVYTQHDSNEYENNTLHHDDEDEILHVKFQGLKLTTTAAVTVISSLSERVKTIDFSNNRIDTFPKIMKKNILGINFAYNAIQNIQLPPNVYGHIIELNLANNRIKK